MASEELLMTFREEVVSGHNEARTSHQAPALSPSEELTRSAQHWAEVIADRGFLQYSETSGLGESILFLDMNGQFPSGDDVTRAWYNKQISHFDFHNPRWKRDSMNFSQMVWKSTNEIGVGVAKDRAHDRYVVVTQYKPPGNGNLPGEFRKNVFPPQ